MNSDWNEFIGVIILFSIFYIILNYLKLYAISQLDWKDFKCNPLYMLTRSIYTSEKQSTNEFYSCVNAVSNPSTYSS